MGGGRDQPHDLFPCHGDGRAISEGPVEPTLYMHYARLIEDVYAAERAREILEDPDVLSTDIINESHTITGRGVGVIEAFKLFLGVVGSLTLVVGGIGVSNIMNVVVEERTREVGIKMSLGARPRVVLAQFLVMPLVPWGFREALLIVALVYLVFTTSTISVVGRFDPQTLWILQFVMVGASLTTLVVISRNILVRRNDIKAQYELELAHDRMELLSLKDPLTGAWNRRFLEQNFNDIIDSYQIKQRPIYFAIIDINDFKPINDNFGHDYGDLVLKKLVKHFIKAFVGNEHLIRMGGDEFAVLMSSDNPKRILQQAADELRVDDELFSASREKQVNLSIGVIEIPLNKQINLDQIYRFADSVMYQAKQKKKQDPPQSNIVITPME